MKSFRYPEITHASPNPSFSSAAIHLNPHYSAHLNPLPLAHQETSVPEVPPHPVEHLQVNIRIANGAFHGKLRLSPVFMAFAFGKFKGEDSEEARGFEKSLRLITGKSGFLEEADIMRKI